MDFFEKQDKARRNTYWLLLYFALALTSMTVIINFAAYWVTRLWINNLISIQAWFQEPFWWISGGVVLTVGAGTLWRLIQLNKGGESLARLLGASPVSPETRLPGERRLINITEEMSIASGVPMPRLFILHSEQGINAFVAGYRLEDMSLTVTQGALEQLTRDELQGIIGHEFSHIHNADTRLNIQIVSVLAGILLIGAIGSFLFRSAFHSSRTGFRVGSRRGNDARSTAALVGAGAVLFVVGYTGLFFGRMIQAAISRQRELLADSSSVQFTRNPDGIGAALFKIGYTNQNSYLTATSKAQEVNHMCFGESLKLNSWFASHPPINQRIDAIDPKLMSRMRSRYNTGKLAPEAGQKDESPISAGISGFASTKTTQAPPPTAKQKPPSALHELAGSVPEDSQRWATHILGELDRIFGDTLHQPTHCELLLYGLVLKETSLMASTQTELKSSDGQSILSHPDYIESWNRLKQLPPEAMMTLLEVATSVLKSCNSQVRQHITQTLKELVAADNKTTFTEFVILSFAAKHLLTKPPEKTVNKPDILATELSVILSMFCFLGTKGSGNQQVSRGPESLFNEITTLYYPLLTKLSYQPSISSTLLSQSIRRVSNMSPLLKPTIIDACAEAVMHDQTVTLKEYQLLRLVIELLDCPMPPVIPGVK
ncbi:M48 family metallopeptidase [Hahella ganghwensis]|uniref:M48 family metallopeptidase n=1 Tax=Hahella ganghwensis TaxID=286420 RepID=UPI00035C887E|nr:M48 family metallopeptidase [Hahella ganghwensis]